jgi:hypothetical protein
LIYKFIKELDEMSKIEVAQTKRYGTKMEDKMKEYNDGNSGDILRKVGGQIHNATENVKGQIGKNLVHLQELEEMDAKTKDLVEMSKEYEGNTRDVYMASWWHNKKYQFLIYGSLGLVVLLIVLFVCKLFL